MYYTARKKLPAMASMISLYMLDESEALPDKVPANSLMPESFSHLQEKVEGYYRSKDSRG